MKKYLITMCTIALFAVGFASSETPASENEREFQGTYLITDEDGVTWTFTFTCGEEPGHQVTAIKEGMDKDDMYYGRWHEVGEDSGIYSLSFDDFYAGDPILKFPDGRTNSYRSLYISDDNWLYKDQINLECKNPEKRIKIVKQ